MPSKVAIGADHGGFELKKEIMRRFKDECDFIDLGAYALEPEDDYPRFSKAVADAVANGEAERGILICGSGVGACIAANKIPGARACLCHDTYSAHQGVEHDDMNILCLGARVVGTELAMDLVRAFVGAQFWNRDRYRRRVDQIKAIEHETMAPREARA